MVIFNAVCHFFSSFSVPIQIPARPDLESKWQKKNNGLNLNEENIEMNNLQERQALLKSISKVAKHRRYPIFQNEKESARRESSAVRPGARLTLIRLRGLRMGNRSQLSFLRVKIWWIIFLILLKWPVHLLQKSMELPEWLQIRRKESTFQQRYHSSRFPLYKARGQPNEKEMEWRAASSCNLLLLI